MALSDKQQYVPNYQIITMIISFGGKGLSSLDLRHTIIDKLQCSVLCHPFVENCILQFSVLYYLDATLSFLCQYFEWLTAMISSVPAMY